MKNNNNDNNSNNNTTQIATLANGCFWCSEAIFKRLKGIKSVLPGYSGGIVKNPSYEQVCTGRTGHAESIQIEFDPKVITGEMIAAAPKPITIGTVVESDALRDCMN